MNNDTDRLNWLETQNTKAQGVGTCLFRRTNRLGWRLMEMTESDAKAIANTDKVFPTVREAVDYAMEQDIKQKEAIKEYK